MEPLDIDTPPISFSFLGYRQEITKTIIKNLFRRQPVQRMMVQRPPNMMMAPQRFVRQCTDCVHVGRPHYAKGMCKSCYNYYGIQKLATNCEHRTSRVFARGMCSKCYNKRRYHLLKEQQELQTSF